MSIAVGSASRTIKVWDLGVRAFHWLLVAAIALAFLSSLDEHGALAAWHVPAGWFAALLIAFRLVWGFVGGEHARFANFIRLGEVVPHFRSLIAGRLEPSLGHNPLGALAVVVLLGATALTVVTGASGAEDGHETIAYVLLALVGLHVVGVFRTSSLTRENLVEAMISGRKDASLHPGASDADPPAPIALPLAAVAVGVAALLAVRSDPKAFTPHVLEESGARGGHDGKDDDD